MITSLNNPLIKELKSIYRNQSKSGEPLFIIESAKLVLESLSSPQFPERVFYARHFSSHLTKDEILKSCRVKNVPVEEISEKALLSVSALEHSDGILATLRKKTVDVSSIQQKKESCVVVLDNIQDPGNLGTILRLCEAFGVSGAFLGDACASLYNPKALRASMGAFFHTPCISGGTRAFLKWLHENAYKIILADVKGEKPLYETGFSGKCALVFGNESRGLPEEFFARADETACIPMHGKLNSINVAWACALFLYERMRQKDRGQGAGGREQ